MWIVQIALRRPLTFIALSLVIVLLGLFTLSRTAVDIFPSIRIPIVATIWHYSGLPPEEMASRIVLGTATMKKYAPEEFLPGTQYQTDDELVVAAGHVGTTIFHPVGTCRMGRADDPRTVVTPDFRVRGIDGLYVVDALIMPTIPSGNINSPTVMVAERAAAMLRAGR